MKKEFLDKKARLGAKKQADAKKRRKLFKTKEYQEQKRLAYKQYCETKEIGTFDIFGGDIIKSQILGTPNQVPCLFTEDVKINWDLERFMHMYPPPEPMVIPFKNYNHIGGIYE